MPVDPGVDPGDTMRLAGSAVIHQPHFLPWPPYLAKLAKCETFIVQDDVLYRRFYFHNRTRILDRRHVAVWLSLPIKAHSTTTLASARIESDHRLLAHLRHVVEDAYSGSPQFQLIWPAVRDFLQSIRPSQSDGDFVAVTIDSIRLLMSLMGLRCPTIVLASTLNVRSDDRTQRFGALAERVGCHTLLTGWGKATEVHDVAALRLRGLTVYSMRREMCLDKKPDYVVNDGLSTLHWLFLDTPDTVRLGVLALCGSMTPVGE